MPSAIDRLEFAPHPDPGALRAFSLAVVAHLLLLAALTWGVNWRHSNPDISFDAELWSSVPQEAAPKPAEALPPPPPPPPAPEPQVKASPPAPAPDADIALEREKKRKLELKKKEAELAKAKAEQEKLKELQAKKEKDLKEKEAKAKEDLAKRKADEKTQDVKAQEKKKLESAAAEKQRQENIKRSLGLAGATGSADSKGSAQKSSGPSASYGGKVRAKVKPNIVFTDEVAGNPTAEVEVRTALDGSIISQRLIKSSGNKAWDDAVIKAIIRTETMPRDVDGRVPTPMILEFKRND
ncbi:MAG TPA: cell envelope integrity protein TolA [Polaromonas sp.]|uniref:cell envelope integrity protein TolA n=1 Tax=Polaromonas sp. TaxID=1869339 RepID=UPI002D68CABD|nr:cell envelope integrity protein TolA [Polaromonas sp.]HYW55689.1 cell envelope integrity protein TolA [Polaromonas sp.]